ncbi:hypothetical protein OG897_08615 [Streptomyces sp. NBC_00237]|uniref:hypothetical protein n=1 Tax=Streptomyces sp. NBC_00237 TaxID=2975687 RepID=UPI00224FE041|nr:hypothetical protein [Streptomyces sp. NBC_00237]MCX5201512.1 hypothetical protein [Streptomyces sp. NBC_00237]
MDDEAFDALIGDIADRLQAEQIQKQAALYSLAAACTAFVWRQATTEGLPPELAKDMASDFWAAVMQIPYTIVKGDED